MASRFASLPSTFRKIIVTKLSTNFTEATEIISTQIPTPKPTEVVIKNKYVGINATDINISAGRYFVGKNPPFDTGLEALGEVAALGSDVNHLQLGQPVAYIGLGCFAEYICVPAANIWTIPNLNPDFLALLISGRTATISLDKTGFIKKGDKVLITAAAGGTGQIAVQYAKAAKCHVLGTCSSDEKVKLLKELGCDRVINYKTENLKDVLKEEYPNGLDIIWETIGGAVFETCLKSIAIRGRLVIIGYITQYQSEKGFQPLNLNTLPPHLLTTSASISGFLLPHYAEEFDYYHAKLLGMHEKSKLRIILDRGEKSGEMFKGLESVSRAVQHLHSGSSIGKVVVELP